MSPLITPRRFYAEKGRRGKRKFIEPVIVKQTKSTKQVVDVYNDMTAKYEYCDTHCSLWALKRFISESFPKRWTLI